MNIFREFEKKLESLFEGVFLRAFRSGVHPVELGKKLVRELEGHKTIGVSRVYVPNRYEVGLSDRDYSRFESYQSVLARELENLLITYIRDKGYVVLDRPRIKLITAPQLKEGDFWIKSSMDGEVPSTRKPAEEKEGEHPLPVETGTGSAAAQLELIDSSKASPLFLLDGTSNSIGRSSENDLVLPDPNVSRNHCRITRRDGSYFITDMDSTNGTWLNDERVTEAELNDRDVIRLGSTRMVFRRSKD